MDFQHELLHVPAKLRFAGVLVMVDSLVILTTFRMLGSTCITLRKTAQSDTRELWLTFSKESTLANQKSVM
jgi:hypothetical protein